MDLVKVRFSFMNLAFPLSPRWWPCGWFMDHTLNSQDVGVKGVEWPQWESSPVVDWTTRGDGNEASVNLVSLFWNLLKSPRMLLQTRTYRPLRYWFTCYFFPLHWPLLCVCESLLSSHPQDTSLVLSFGSVSRISDNTGRNLFKVMLQSKMWEEKACVCFGHLHITQHLTQTALGSQ